MGDISADNKKGSQLGFEQTSSVNQLNFMVKQGLQELQTSFLARVDLCESQEEATGATYTSITPLVSQSDTEGTSLPMVSIPKIPFTRYQFGNSAVIIDPIPGDIVVASVAKNDGTNVKQGVTEPVTAGSMRHFSQSDSVVVGAVHTSVPENYVVLRQDKTMLEHIPEGIRVETDKTIDEYMGENRLTEITKDRTEKVGGNFTQDVTGNTKITIGGELTGDISGNTTITIGGGLTIQVQGSADITINGSANITANGSMTVKAPSITFDTPTASFTGNVTIAGGLSQGGGGARSARAANGNDAWFANNINTQGSITAQGTITSSSDCVGGGISLKGHVHGNGNDGQDTTGPK